MPSIDDWAAKAARQILHVQPGNSVNAKRDRIAAIIATFAAPLVTLLRESRREHYHCEDAWYCCGKCQNLDHCCYDGTDPDYPASHGGEAARESGICNCDADAWNARVDAALEGRKP